MLARECPKLEWCDSVPTEEDINNDEFDDVYYSMTDLMSIFPNAKYGDTFSMNLEVKRDGLIRMVWHVVYNDGEFCVEAEESELIDALAEAIIQILEQCQKKN